MNIRLGNPIAVLDRISFACYNTEAYLELEQLMCGWLWGVEDFIRDSPGQIAQVLETRGFAGFDHIRKPGSKIALTT